MSRERSDVLVIGAGIVGASCALACAQRGMKVSVLSHNPPGNATGAAAGMLAPSIDPPSGDAAQFALAARDYYPGFIAALEEQSGLSIPFDRSGILELVAADRLLDPRHRSGRGALVSPGDLKSLEPQVRFSPELWAFHHAGDGWVDNVKLFEALHLAVGRIPSLTRLEAAAIQISFAADGVSIRTDAGDVLGAVKVILAAGAWSALINGLPRSIPIEPVRGQMLAVQGIALNHVVLADRGYAVPRTGNRAVLGSTMERAGYDPVTTVAGIQEIRDATAPMGSTFANAKETARWAGLRPMTPDLLPIIGAEPREPGLIYACGHSRNGILLGPFTAHCLAALLAGSPIPANIGPFCASRFS